MTLLRILIGIALAVLGWWGLIWAFKGEFWPGSDDGRAGWIRICSLGQTGRLREGSTGNGSRECVTGDLHRGMRRGEMRRGFGGGVLQTLRAVTVLYNYCVNYQLRIMHVIRWCPTVPNCTKLYQKPGNHVLVQFGVV